MADPRTPLPPSAGLPAEGADDRLGFEHLGWTPTWRERVEEAGGRLSSWLSPPRVAGATVAVVAVVAVAVAVVLRGPAPPPPELHLPLAGGPGDPAATTTTSTTVPAVVEVVAHAAGAVARPGVYRLPGGARVADLLDAAGGAGPEADLDRVNLAAPLADGERVFVPVPEQEVPPVAGGAGAAGGGASGVPPAPGAGAPVDLNAATAADLDVLPGVGPATAAAILAERDRRGGFTSVEDLLDVRGIGEAKLAALRDLVAVG